MPSPWLRSLIWVPLLLVACSGKVTDEPGGGTGGIGGTGGTCASGDCIPDSGPQACKDGARKAAGDGCNSCSCSGGKWACTDLGCGVCTEGQTKPVGTGCNTCTCTHGAWECTNESCLPLQCKLGDTMPSGDGCNVCSCPDGHWDCSSHRPCPTPPICMEGETKGTGCNACTCKGGNWECSLVLCVDSGPPPVCADGATKQADDGCNTCSCSNGTWLCTQKACPAPDGAACGGFLGNTCAADEYCAYEEGALCGAADAGAYCKKRPTSCTTNYAPVCACDGKTYGNACSAAMAGYGLSVNAACALPN